VPEKDEKFVQGRNIGSVFGATHVLWTTRRLESELALGCGFDKEYPEVEHRSVYLQKNVRSLDTSPP